MSCLANMGSYLVVKKGEKSESAAVAEAEEARMKRSSGLWEPLQLYAESPAMKGLAPVFVAVVSDTSVAVATAQTLQLYANSPVIKGLAPAFVVALVSDTGPALKSWTLTRAAAMNIGPGLRDWMLVVAVATALTLQL